MIETSVSGRYLTGALNSDPTLIPVVFILLVLVT